MVTKRGRPSVGDLTAVNAPDARIAPPKALTRAQRKEWSAIVDSLPADFFRPSDVPMLAAFCVSAALYAEAAALIERDGMLLTAENGRKYAHPAKDFLTATGAAMAQMAVKLRLCPSSRYTAQKGATKTPSAPRATSRPWQTAA